MDSLAVNSGPEINTQFKVGGLLLNSQVTDSANVVRFKDISNWSTIPGVINCACKARELKMIYKICLKAETLLAMKAKRDHGLGIVSGLEEALTGRLQS